MEARGHLAESGPLDQLVESEGRAERELVQAALPDLRGRHGEASGRSTSSAPPTQVPRISGTDRELPSFAATSARNALESKPNFRPRSCSASRALQVRCKSPMKLSTTPLPAVATA